MPKDKARIKRSNATEIFYDLVAMLTAEGLRRSSKLFTVMPDSRQRYDLAIDWANEFQTLHHKTDWYEKNYFDESEAFFKDKLEHLYLTKGINHVRRIAGHRQPLGTSAKSYSQAL
jgi:hypothetical protein